MIRALEALAYHHLDVAPKVKQLKKELENINTQTRDILQQLNLSSYISDDYEINISVPKESVQLNDDLAVKIVEEKFPNLVDSLVITKKIIDQTVMERLSYENPDFLNAFTECFIKQESNSRLYIKKRGK